MEYECVCYLFTSITMYMYILISYTSEHGPGIIDRPVVIALIVVLFIFLLLLVVAILTAILFYIRARECIQSLVN